MDSTTVIIALMLGYLVGHTIGRKRTDQWASPAHVQEMALNLCPDQMIVVEAEDKEHGMRTLRVHYMGADIDDDDDEDEDVFNPLDADRFPANSNN